MRRQLGIAACCLAISVSPALAGCSPNSDTKGQQSQAGIESSQSATVKETTQGAAKVNYKDGTYEGKGQGMGGPIYVKLSVANGIVKVDEISQTAETAGVGGKEAVENGTFKAQIEKAQSADIDGVSGATMTTGGVKKAVEEALAQAK